MVFLQSLNFLLLDVSYTLLGDEIKFDQSHLKYGLFASFSRNAHCDGSFLKYTLGDMPASDFETSCGMACRDILQYAETAKFDVDFWQNKVDHTQFVSFQTNTSMQLGGDFDTQAVLAFRGTVAFDIINNRRNLVFKFASSTLCPSCAIHQGFWRNFLSLRPALVEIIGKMKGAAFTGMSMGAPIATLAAVTASDLKMQPVGCVTFGMPRVANSEFAIYFLQEINNLKSPGFAYGRDPVPHVPPRFFGFRSTQSVLYHTLQHYLITAEMDKSVWNTKVDDHDIGNYIYFDKAYWNTDKSFRGDKMFAGSSSTFNLGDHLKYFDTIGMHGCGYDSSDAFLHVSNAAELFFV